METNSGDSMKNRDESSELSLSEGEPVTVPDGAVSIHFHTLCVVPTIHTGCPLDPVWARPLSAGAGSTSLYFVFPKIK